MELIRITELTSQLGVSSRTLRYYEQVGLIHSVRPEFEAYRYYDEETVERLRQIMVLRKMQIPIKDIQRIYESQDMSVLVESFVERIHSIDREVTALSEMKRIVNNFLQAMLRNGITKISALPLLYEEMDKQLDILEERHVVSYEQLTEASERLEKPADLRIVALPSLRVLSSWRKEGAEPESDVEGFWSWLNDTGVPIGLPGQHSLFEYQDEAGRNVLLQRIGGEFVNDGPYRDYPIEAGLYAVGGVYVDEDLEAFYRRMIRSFDDNPYYEVDYRHDGRLRHDALAESVLSPDGRREKVELFLPIKKRLPNAALYEPCEQVEGLSVREIEDANPVLWAVDVPMDGLKPILDPYYRVNEAGEAEYIAYIDKRLLSTEVAVELPFRVDIEFRVEDESARYGYGCDEGSIRFFHGANEYGVNMENNADPRLSQEVIRFHQPIFRDVFLYPGRGRIQPNIYNRLTWIVGEKHLAVILNGEVRYCGMRFPYMQADWRGQRAEIIRIGSNGQGKRYFRSIRVSQLKRAPKIQIKEGALTMITKPSNNAIPNIHQLITMHYGENYWFNGCARYVMEALGEPDYEYWFFAGLTGDNLAQIYSKNFRGDSATEYRVSAPFIEGVFDACGYDSSFVSEKALNTNREMYRQTLMAYIDKGVPVIRYQQGWGVFVGYEEYGKTLLYMTADYTEPERIPFDQALPTDCTDEHQLNTCGWIFVGGKKRQVDLRQLYRDAIRNLPRLLTTQTEAYCFGPEAFRSWAAEIEGGRFDGMKPEEFHPWFMYTVYVCNLATNSGGCQSFLEKAQELNPDFAFLEEVRRQYQQTGHLWNDQNGEDLEAIGGGFNITLEALQNPEKRRRIVAKIREFADCMDRVLEVLEENLKEGKA